MTRAGGSLGALSTRAFLAMLASEGASGTLFLERGAATSLLALARGKLVSHTDLGEAFDLEGCGAQFGFWSHCEHALPTLPSRYSGLPGAWALPALTETPLLTTAETDLRALVVRLTGDAFSGALVLENASVRGLLVFQKGQLGGALTEELTGEGARLRSGSAALRPLLHPAEPAALTLHALPEIVSASLLGWLLGLQVSDQGGPPRDFTGLELSATGARYYRAGTPYLEVPHPARLGGVLGLFTPGLFALCNRVPSLTLPTEPPGWEGLRYTLTLRGRDALNPMTELSMRFRGEFGGVGRRSLEGFRGNLSVEEAAEALHLDLSEFRETVERLEAQGFIRPVGDPSPTGGGYTR